MTVPGADEYPPIPQERKSGGERFHAGGSDLGFALLQFWQWSYSNLVGNTDRGAIAEFLVAAALGAHTKIRNDWAPFDLTTPAGRRVEVKSASYVQTWYQRKLTRIAFSIRPTRAWDPATNTYEEDARRAADVYVFCLLKEKNRDRIDPLDVEQWDFYVLPTKVLDRECPTARSIGLERLKSLTAQPCGYYDLLRAIEGVR